MKKKSLLEMVLLTLLSHYKTMNRVQVRVDNQSGMVALVNDKVLKKLNIEIIPGDPKNVNKNPVAERAVREIEVEIFKIEK